MLNVYLLNRATEFNYDEFIGKVIIAAHSDQARKIANIKTGDEGRIWQDPEKVNCIKMPLNFPSVVLESFNTG